MVFTDPLSKVPAGKALSASHYDKELQLPLQLTKFKIFFLIENTLIL